MESPESNCDCEPATLDLRRILGGLPGQGASSLAVPGLDITLSLDLLSLISSESSPPHLSLPGRFCGGGEVHGAVSVCVYDSPAVVLGAHLSAAHVWEGPFSSSPTLCLPHGDAGQRVLAMSI